MIGSLLGVVCNVLWIFPAITCCIKLGSFGQTADDCDSSALLCTAECRPDPCLNINTACPQVNPCNTVVCDKGIRNYSLDYRDTKKATTQIIEQHLANENMSPENLRSLAAHKGISLDVDVLVDSTTEKPFDELSKLAECLEIEVSDLMIPAYKGEDEVVVKERSEQFSYNYPTDSDAVYKIYPLAQCSKMPLMKGSDIQVLVEDFLDKQFLHSSLHSYVYNYGDSAVAFRWHNGEGQHDEVLEPGDSVYIQPFVKHAFANRGSENGSVIAIRVSGSVNFSTQKELSYFADVDRIIESKCWFD